MRKVLLGLAVAFGALLAGCDTGPRRPNDPPPTPQDSGADKKPPPRPGMVPPNADD